MVFSWNSSKISKIRTKLTFEFLSKKKTFESKNKRHVYKVEKQY